MNIGLSTYSLDNKDFREQLSSMLKNGVNPDFIILHYGGIYRPLKGYSFLKKTLKQRRLKSLSFLLSYRKHESGNPYKFKLDEPDSKEVDLFISSAKIIKTAGINDTSTIRVIRKIGEVIIASNSGRINSGTLTIPNAIFLNVHASRLPKYRGINNVEWALWENEEIYASIHKISPRIDEGDILYQEKINTNTVNLKTISEYREYCFFESNLLIGKAIKGYLDKKLFFIKQTALENPLNQYYVMHPVLKEYLQKRISGS